MKIFNTHGRQTFQHDHTDPDTGKKTSYVIRPNRSANVPDEVGKYLLKAFPKHFSVDEEAQSLRVQQKQAIEERDAQIADLTKRVLEAEARANKAEAALEALAEKAEADAAKDPLGTASLGGLETAAPAAPAAGEKKKPGRKPKEINLDRPKPTETP